MSQFALDLGSYRFHLTDPVYLISEELNPNEVIISVSGENLNRISPNPEVASSKFHVISVVLDRHQVLDQFISVLGHAGAQRY